MRDDSCFGRLCALLRGEAIVFDDEFEAYYRKVKAAIVEPAGFHSQCGQDRVVCELLEYKRGGVFMDLGAHDGVK